MTCLSRTVIGMIQKPQRQQLVVTLPGKPKAVVENLTILVKVMKHALSQC
jgi:molybdopterin biosynthesis enzyme MoaB